MVFLRNIGRSACLADSFQFRCSGALGSPHLPQPLNIQVVPYRDATVAATGEGVTEP